MEKEFKQWIIDNSYVTIIYTSYGIKGTVLYSMLPIAFGTKHIIDSNRSERAKNFHFSWMRINSKKDV